MRAESEGLDEHFAALRHLDLKQVAFEQSGSEERHPFQEQDLGIKGAGDPIGRQALVPNLARQHPVERG